MNEIPVTSTPFRYSIPTDTFNPIWGGIKMGAITAFVLSGTYAVAMTPILLWMLNQPHMLASTSFNLQNGAMVFHTIVNIYGFVFIASILGLMVGAGPACFVGVTGGAIIGAIFRYGVRRKLRPRTAIFYGFWMSLFLLAGRSLLWGCYYLLTPSTWLDQLSWLIWFGPNLIAFFGLWWVAYKVNQKMPTA
jgi:hypothetical protein